MATPDARRTLDLLAALSHHANFSVGCYCEDESRCHRSLLRELLARARRGRRRPGELLHLDAKKLARIQRVGHAIHGDQSRRIRGVGWEFAHVGIDSFTRLSYAEVLPNERAETTAGFLRRALTWYQARASPSSDS